MDIERNRSTIIISIIIGMILLIFLLIGISILNRQNELKKEEYKKNNPNNNIAVLDFIYGTGILYNEEVYISLDNIYELDKYYDEDITSLYYNLSNNYRYFSFDNLNYTINNNRFYGIKLDTYNIKGIYSFSNGQEYNENFSILLLDNNNRLSTISLYSLLNGKKTPLLINKLTDITNVITENNNGNITYAIDSNNNKIDLNDYIPKDYKTF